VRPQAGCLQCYCSHRDSEATSTCAYTLHRRSKTPPPTQPALIATANQVLAVIEAQKSILIQKTPLEVIRSWEGPGGKMLAYVEHAWVNGQAQPGLQLGLVLGRLLIGFKEVAEDRAECYSRPDEKGDLWYEWGMLNIQHLINDAKCYEAVRELRWPNGVQCPDCQASDIRKCGFHSH
jgi:hypothetical protein